MDVQQKAAGNMADLRRKLNLENLKQKFRDWRRWGYEITDIRSEPSSDRNANASKEFTDRIWMKTPYTYDGYPLLGFCTVEHNGDDRTPYGAELWTVDRNTGEVDRNIEDVYEEDHGTRDFVVQNSFEKRDADFNRVQEEVSECAFVASAFPHVMHYDEYMIFQRRNCERLKLDAPDGSGYSSYLEHCENLMRSGDMPFVGELHDPDRVNLRNLELPEFQENGMQAEDAGMEL